MRVTAARPCLAILLVASAIACDSTVEVPWNAPDTVTPGSRLRPWMAVAGDAAGFLGWHDTELGVGCSFTNAADGVKRCMPLRWSVVFVDSMCSQPALLTYCGYEVDYGALRDATLLQEQCAAFDPYDPPSFMYRRSDAPLQADAYYRGRIENGEVVCDPVPQALEPHESLVSAVPMSLENFVAGQELIEPGEGRLGTRVMVASDGARHIIGPYDTAFARQCRSTPDWADGRECVSFSSQWPGFADASCSQPAVVTRCAPPVVVSERVDQCTIRLSSVGPPVDHYYNYSEGSCESDEPLPDGYQAYQVGPELALGQLPAIKMRNVGSGQTVRHGPRGVLHSGRVAASGCGLRLQLGVPREARAGAFRRSGLLRAGLRARWLRPLATPLGGARSLSGRLRHFGHPPQSETSAWPTRDRVQAQRQQMSGSSARGGSARL